MAAPLNESAVADLQRSHGKYIYHGTDVHVVEAIVAQGLLPGGGPGDRLANHFVVGPMPTQWSEARGFRRGSNAVVQCSLEVLLRAGVRLFSGADGVLLADTVPTSAIFRILAADNQRGEYTEVLAEIGSDRPLNLVRDLRAEAVEAAAAAMGTSVAATGSADVGTPAAPAEGAEGDDAAEEQAGAAVAAPTERSAADVDMGEAMTEAAAANPGLTVLHKAEEYLEQQGAAASGAVLRARRLARRSVRKQAPPTATLAAFSGEAQVVPDAEADGTYACPECGKGVDTVVRWHLHRAACHEIPLPHTVFPEPTNTDQFRQDYRGVWFRLSREGHFFEMTEANFLLRRRGRSRPTVAVAARKIGRNKASSTLEPENAPPRPPSGPRAEARAAGVEFTAGAALTGGAQPAADAPGQPIVFSSRQLYRWESWMCYFCNGVNPQEADDCFYQPVGGPHVGARCGGNRAGCDEWNLSFRNLCYKCNGRRTAAGVLSRCAPDPRRDDQDRAESDSDDSAALDVRQDEQEDLEATLRPLLRSPQEAGQLPRHSWCAVPSPSACRRGATTSAV
ncbi:hypothetical protein AK812_SmicGene35774 [Symbiodinium microadriaticum]|uniref:C2H2-type domain-containing protein n=1 Tax=Symbiodinium microadriaticum TaxID=2951 RepID=A0A1Q9CKJ8_SYMMI|nr:hypothetical protein AK812_SmicGene35774 [Symbiodinium microadriaticum]